MNSTAWLLIEQSIIFLNHHAHLYRSRCGDNGYKPVPAIKENSI